MTRPAPHSRYALDAVRLVGQLIREARLARRQTAAELAERLGVSRGLVHRIERGDPGCAVGSVFEAAAVLDLTLFDSDGPDLARELGRSERRLALLPSAARQRRIEVEDDF